MPSTDLSSASSRAPVEVGTLDLSTKLMSGQAFVQSLIDRLDGDLDKWETRGADTIRSNLVSLKGCVNSDSLMSSGQRSYVCSIFELNAYGSSESHESFDLTNDDSSIGFVLKVATFINSCRG